MRDYFSVLFMASLLGAVCTSLAGSRLEKYMRYLASLLCILLIISPLRKLELSHPDLPGEATSHVSGQTLTQLAQQEAEAEICRAISSAIFAGTGITPASVCIEIDWNTDQPVISTVSLTLLPEDFRQSGEVCDWVESSFGVPCHATKHEGSS